MTVIEARALTKQFGRVTALENLSFSLEADKITGLIGPNGAGKTTLMKIIAGFIRESRGEVKVWGQNPFNNLNISANSFYVEEKTPFPVGMALTDILETAGSFYPNWDGKLARGLFDYFGLDPHTTFPKLSKGKKSTFVALIGISARCALTIFDEPTTGMDASVRKDFYRALLKDYLQHPRTILLSSHLLNEIENVLEEVLLIGGGNKILHLPVSELKEYAVGLRGKSELIYKLIENRNVIRQEKFGKDGVYVVVKNDTLSLRERARLAGVEVVGVETSDLCVYLTSERKGGIDDVFESN